MRYLLAVTLFVCGCSTVGAPVEELVRLPVDDAGQDAADPPSDDAGAAPDVTVLDAAPDAATVEDAPAEADVAQDATPDVDVSDAGQDAPVDASVDTAPTAPDHINQVWCVQGQYLYLGCDGFLHPYDVSGTTWNGSYYDCVGSRTDITATCTPGTPCTVTFEDGGTVTGTCQ